jgi:hypothetical protein
MEATHKKYSSIDNAPCQIAAQRTDEHRPYLHAICGCYTERAGAGEHHD